MATVILLYIGGRVGYAQTPIPMTNEDEDFASEINNWTNGLGSWIWSSNYFDRQTCQFWKNFEIPQSSSVRHAILRVTADNEYTLYLDGQELGRGAEWRHLGEYNLDRLLVPGKHVLAVKAFNSSSVAGLILGLRVYLYDGRVIHVKTDDTWRLVPDDQKGWEERLEPSKGWPCATVVAALGEFWWRYPESVEVVPPVQPIVVRFWQTGWFQVTLVLVCVLVTLISLHLMMQLGIHRKERWLLQRERERIARDIHDDIGSRMTQLVLHGEVAQSELPSGSEARAELDRLCEDARQALSTLDEILWAVNPRRDTLRDFVSFVCAYAEAYLKHTQIKCLLQVEPEISVATLDLPFRRSLLMAVKETLNNAVKYSGATELSLQIHGEDQMLIVVVQDNGKGFDPQKLKGDRHGMKNMADRMAELGGTFALTTEPGKGCRIEFQVPLGDSAKTRGLWRGSFSFFHKHKNNNAASHVTSS